MRNVGDVMHGKVINGFTTCTRIDVITVNGVDCRYEVIARMTMKHPHDNCVIDMVCYVGTDYSGVLLVVNGAKRGDVHYTHASDAYASFAILADKYNGIGSVVFDGVFLTLFGIMLNGDGK